jgi:membrane-associated phospholipid phosphatase
VKGLGIWPSDWIIFAYIAIISFILGISFDRISWAYLLAVYHILMILLIGLILFAYSRFRGRFWRVLRCWYPILVLSAGFRELGYIIPCIHPFRPEFPYDKVLHKLDQMYFLWVWEFYERISTPLVTEILNICYWMYFFIPLILCLVLYCKGDLTMFHRVLCCLLIAWFISYLGYICIPAVGPHIAIDEQRPEVLNGILISKPLYWLILELEQGVPGAFPSGHTMITLCVLYLARHIKAVFYPLLPIGIGLIIATVYLHYHYVSDIVAAFILTPPSIWIGSKLAKGYRANPLVGSSSNI